MVVIGRSSFKHVSTEQLHVLVNSRKPIGVIGQRRIRYKFFNAMVDNLFLTYWHSMTFPLGQRFETWVILSLHNDSCVDFSAYNIIMLL
jgi:hypothetical protein